MNLLFQIPLLQYKIYFLLAKKHWEGQCLPWDINTQILRLRKFLDQKLRNSLLWTRSLVDSDIPWTLEFPVWERAFVGSAIWSGLTAMEELLNTLVQPHFHGPHLFKRQGTGIEWPQTKCDCPLSAAGCISGLFPPNSSCTLAPRDSQKRSAIGWPHSCNHPT